MGQYTYYCPACDSKVSIICSYEQSLKPKYCQWSREFDGHLLTCSTLLIRDEIAEPGVGSSHSDKAYKAKVRLSDGTTVDTPASHKKGLLWF